MRLGPEQFLTGSLRNIINGDILAVRGALTRSLRNIINGDVLELERALTRNLRDTINGDVLELEGALPAPGTSPGPGRSRSLGSSLGLGPALLPSLLQLFLNHFHLILLHLGSGSLDTLADSHDGHGNSPPNHHQELYDLQG